MSLRSSRSLWFVFAGVALISIGLGFTGAKILANEPISYVAVYTRLSLMIIGVPLVLALFLAGAILNFFPRTRWLGLLGIAAAVLIVVSSFTSFKILDALGKVRYKHEQMQPLVPEVAELAIFFKTDATHDEVESFWEETLSTRQGTGHWPRPGISGILRHLPVQGHEVVVVSFFPNATDAEREDIKSRVASSSIVYKCLENIPYAEIENVVRPTPSEKTTSNKSLQVSRD